MNQPGPISAKICGLRTAADVETAARAGADFVGFMHYAKSPRHIAPEAAKDLAATLPASVRAVSVLVDPGDDAVASVSGWTHYIQLHGAETPARVAQIARLAGKPIIKAIAVADERDLEPVADYGGLAEILLFDAKPPTSGDLQGGNGLTFDWRLLADTHIETPWMLSGGLDAENVKEAIRLTGARMVDVSSGVEKTRGVKSPEKIRAFMAAVKEASV
jgi:phosphoribosylanthranilate isomerase